MTKPVITSFNEIAPLMLQQYERYLPTAFDNSLTILEKMNYMMEHLNNMGKVSNEVITQWNNVMEWVMGDGLDTSVMSKLDEMLANGTFEGLINETIFEGLNTEINNVGQTVSKHTTQIEDISVSIKKYENLVVNNDWEPAFRQALQNHNRIFVPKGTYKVSPITVPSGKTIEGVGKETVFEPLTTGTIFLIEGTIGSELNVTSNVADFGSTIAVSNASTLGQGDMILLKSQRDSLNEVDSGETWTLGYATPGAPGPYFGEFLQLKSVVNNVLTTVAPTIFPSYRADNTLETSTNARANSTVQKVSFVEDVTLKHFKINKPSGTAIRYKYAKDCVIENVHHNANGYTDNMLQFIAFYESLDCEARDCSFIITHSINPSQHHYVNIYKAVSSFNCGFVGCYGKNATQTCDFSYNTGSIPSVNCYVEKCTFIDAIQSSCTSHGGTFQCRWIGNIFKGSKQGIACRTKGSIISNNILVGMRGDSKLHYGIGLYEGHATDCVISNNTILGFYCGITISDAVDEGETFKYVGAMISGNTIKNYVYGICINKNSRKLFNYMSIKIVANVLMASHTGTSFGVWLGEYTNDVIIDNNTITGSSDKYNVANARGVWGDYNANNIKVFRNSIRNVSTGFFLRGSNDTPTTGGKVLFAEGHNTFRYVDNPTTVSVVTGMRLDSTHRTINFGTQTETALVDNSSFFIDSVDGKLKFKNSTGVVKEVTLV